MSLEVDLRGRRVLVVGASSGVGRSTALSIAGRGGQVAVVGRRAAQLDEVAAAAGGGVAIPADLVNPADCERVVEVATEALGGLDAVLFPVGYSPLQLMAKLTHETWARAFGTNVVGPALVTGAAVRARTEPGGLFLYVSSANVPNPLQGLGAYGATKAALEHSIRTWRLEHPEHRFITLTIGATMPTDIHRDFTGEVLSEVLPKWANGVVTAEFMHVDDVGAAIAELTAFALAHPKIAVDDVVFNPASVPVDVQTRQKMGERAASGEFSDAKAGRVQEYFDPA
ncbi:MAG: SDR family oxidoreductase [Frankia sp.]|nr:SDR family oxidoreductase [Frankia sp.]